MHSSVFVSKNLEISGNFLFFPINFFFSAFDFFPCVCLISRVNKEFQEACESILNSKKLLVNCKFDSGFVKMKSRCLVKAVTRYTDRKYPISANLLDVIRCSVTFDNAKDLIAGLEKFEQKIAIDEKKDSILKCLIRRRNSFGDIEERLDYSDIKINVLVKVHNVSMIGEVQFLLSFMENFKNRAHGTYRFMRKESFFNQLSDLYYDTSKENDLLNIIATKNFTNFEKLMLYFDVSNFDINPIKLLLMLYNEYAWEKGCLLFWYTILKTNDKKLVSSIVNSVKLWDTIFKMNKVAKWQKQFALQMVDTPGKIFKGYRVMLFDLCW